MSKERELLLQSANILSDFKNFEQFAEKIYELLAQPEQTEQEPVAWIIETEMYGKLSEWVCTDKKHYKEHHDSIKEPIPLYTAPPKRDPLSDDEIYKLSLENFKGLLSDRINFVRAIEKAHGIGGGNENI